MDNDLKELVDEAVESYIKQIDNQEESNRKKLAMVISTSIAVIGEEYSKEGSLAGTLLWRSHKQISRRLMDYYKIPKEEYLKEMEKTRDLHSKIKK